MFSYLSSKGHSAASQKKKTQQNIYQTTAYAVEISYNNFTSNYKDWDTDMAIMFYTPWCKYCKQLGTSWEQIARISKDNRDLTVGKINCEKTENVDICLKIGVDRYPSVFFLGYGDMHQANQGNPFAKNDRPRLAQYNADLYPEAIYDWINMLAKVSSMQRSWVDFKSVFGGKSRSVIKVEKLQSKISVLENKIVDTSIQLDKFKADELFTQLEDNGDPFPLMATLEPDEKNLPFRVCVGEMSEEYCKYHYEEEPFCLQIEDCRDENMVSGVCRPDKCPFKNPLGCKVASTCLKKSVIEKYKEALNPTKAAPVTAGTGGSGSKLAPAKTRV